MNVLNIHGYHGSPQNAACAALKANGCNVISPEMDYDAKSPEQLLIMLREIIAKNDIARIAGTSLGGFFAAALCAELHLPVMLVNPCLLPFLHLPRLGFAGEIRPFIPVFGTFSQIAQEDVSCIVGADDEVIDSHDFTRNLVDNERFLIIPGGKHSGATLPLEAYFAEVLHNKI